MRLRSSSLPFNWINEIGAPMRIDAVDWFKANVDIYQRPHSQTAVFR